jgi:hypothetical protein
VWQLTAKHSLRLLHKYQGRDFAALLDLFDKDIPDEEGEPAPVRKADSAFFERIVGILPLQVKHMTKDHLVRTLEVVVKHGLGADRLFRDYLLLKIERNIMKFSVEHYSRILRALADKQYVEDSVFWNEYILKYLLEESPGKHQGEKREKQFTDAEARKLWDALIYLKLKCPSLDLKVHISHVEKFMQQEQQAAAQVA